MSTWEQGWGRPVVVDRDDGNGRAFESPVEEAHLESPDRGGPEVESRDDVSPPAAREDEGSSQESSGASEWDAGPPPEHAAADVADAPPPEFMEPASGPDDMEPASSLDEMVGPAGPDADAPPVPEPAQDVAFPIADPPPDAFYPPDIDPSGAEPAGRVYEPSPPPVDPLLGALAEVRAPAPDARRGHDPTRPPSPRARPLPRTLAIANQKGGVGKTTTAVNLGAGLADLGYRVLVIDLDPQGNATTGLGIDARNLGASVYDVLLADRALEDAIEPTAVRNLFVAPATLDLAGAEIELVPAFSRELKLRRAVDGLDGEYDFTLIDCPPSLGLLTVNGLAAADEVLVPVQCEYYALEGLGQLLRNIQLVQSNLNPRLELSTIVLTMYDARTKLSDQVASEVRTHFGDRVCRNIVPRSVRLSEAPSFGQPIIVFDPTSRGAIAYRELAKEVSGGTPRRTG